MGDILDRLLQAGEQSKAFTRFRLRFVDSLFDAPTAAGREEAAPGR